jgi:hypothetical protein
MTSLFYDCETNGFLKNMTKLTCLVIRDEDTRQTWRFRNREAGRWLTKLGKTREECEYDDFTAENNIADGVEMLQNADRRIGHNLIGFDEKAIKKIYPWYKPKGEIKDTLVLSRVIVPDTKGGDYRLNEKGMLPGALIGKHSLDAWGWRLGLHKGDYKRLMESLGFNPFEHWNLPCEDYCEGDVDVTEVLWTASKKNMPPPMADELEHQIHDLAVVMEHNGFPFDREKAEALSARLEEVHADLTDKLKQKYGYWYAPAKKHQVKMLWDDPAGVNAQREYKKPRPEFGEDMSRAVWADVLVSKKSMRSKSLGDRTEGAAYCPLKKKEFNPNSRPHIIDRFTTVHGWIPHEFTETGQPSVTGPVLQELATRIPEAEPLSELFFYQKTLGQVKTGKGSWLNAVQEDGKIHGYINTGGTVSARCAHLAPNMGQVPSVKVLKYKDGFVWDDDKKLDLRPDQYLVVGKKAVIFGREGDFGWECRSLFYTPKLINGVPWLQCGVDLSGIEFRCLAEECVPFDDGALIDVILSGDIHQINMDSTGVTDRVKIKRIIYALLYGGGDLKLGLIYDPLMGEGQARGVGARLRADLMRGLPALKKAVEKVKYDAQGGFLTGLDGRLLHCRSQHASFNLRLQSNAALIAKKWVVLSEQYLLEAGLDHGWEGDFVFLAFVHDELQFAVKEEFAEMAATLVKKAAADAGLFFNFRCPIDSEAKFGNNWAETH